MIKPSNLEIAQSATINIDPQQAFSLISHSIAVGSLLMLTTALISIQNLSKPGIPQGAPSGVTTNKPSPTKFDCILNASNVLYMCLGMTGIMILVSDSIARAFAIGAAIAIVRFRIKVDSKSFGMCLFYGVLAGMACGVDHVQLAYIMAALFSALQAVVFLIAFVFDKKEDTVSISSTTTQQPSNT